MKNHNVGCNTLLHNGPGVAVGVVTHCCGGQGVGMVARGCAKSVAARVEGSNPAYNINLSSTQTSPQTGLIVCSSKLNLEDTASLELAT
jgi:hypothetical protein